MSDDKDKEAKELWWVWQALPEEGRISLEGFKRQWQLIDNKFRMMLETDGFLIVELTGGPKRITMREVFIGRKVHDQLLEHSPGLIEEIFEREPEPIWQLWGVSVRMTPALYDSFTRTVKELR